MNSRREVAYLGGEGHATGGQELPIRLLGSQHTKLYFRDEVHQILNLLGKRRVLQVLRLVRVHGVVARGSVDGSFSGHGLLVERGFLVQSSWRELK